MFAMTVRQLRAKLFEIDNQDCEVCVSGRGLDVPDVGRLGVQSIVRDPHRSIVWIRTEISGPE